jgi:anaerobic selenocysteine-containing dehydrogenase
VSEESHIIRRSVCPHDCWDTCSVLVHVDGDTVTKVVGNPEHPITRGFLCAKGYKLKDRTHAADRVLFPMRRVGPKGAGEFERISWETALGTVATKLAAAAAEYGPSTILPYSYCGTLGFLQNNSLGSRFFHRLGASNLERTICSAAADAAQVYTYGITSGPDVSAMARAELIIVWGCNMTSTAVHQWPFVLEARKHGARLVVIDPYRNAAARAADVHLRPHPGTDGALALALCHVLIAEGLHDDAFVRAYTVGFGELTALVQDCTPEWAEAETGIAAEVIRHLAREYAATHPSIIRVGYGLARHDNGGQTVRAICMLPALVGAWRHADGGLLISTFGDYPVDWEALKLAGLAPSQARTINMMQLGHALTELNDPPVKALVVYNANPFAAAPDSNRVLAGLEREDLFTVVLEQVMTDTARFADILLPATTQFEHEELISAYGNPYIQHVEPVIAPRGEALPNNEIFRRLARGMGFEEPCLYETDQEIMAKVFHWDHPAMRGITLESIKRAGIVRVNRWEGSRLQWPTPSGKIELYSETMAREGHSPLPVYRRPAESVANPGDSRYPLHLLTPKAHHFTNSTWANTPDLMAKEGEPVLYVHPDDAAARGLRSGDWCRLFNDRGEVRLPVEVSDKAGPGVLVSPAVHWPGHFSGGEVGINALTSQRLSDIGGGATFYSVLVQIAPVQP